MRKTTNTLAVKRFSSYQSPAALPVYQQGFTIIELMIAALLGLVLIGGMIQIFLGSSQTFRVQRAIGEVQDKGRTAMDFIGREIENAGFGGNGLVASAFSTLSQNVDFTAGTTNGTGVGNNDSIRIQYTGTTDCTGANIVAPFLVVNTFDVNGDELRCNGQPLINGVESFHVLYGIDTDNDRFVDQYQTADRVIASGNQTRVMAVRIGMIVASENVRVFSDDISQNIKILDEAPLTKNDKRLRRKFTSTTMLANRP